MVRRHFDHVVKCQARGAQMLLREFEGIPKLRLGVGCYGEIGTNAGYSRKEDEVAGVEDRGKMPVLDEMDESRRREGCFHQRFTAVGCAIQRRIVLQSPLSPWGRGTG